MKKIIACFLFLLSFVVVSAWDNFTQYSIADELKKPSVKLVAVDFYATWCEPCKAAIPKWKELQRKYGDKGLELIVVSVKSEGRCAQPPQWNPNKTVCDSDGKIADAWHVFEKGLPEAFLWRWDGKLLVSHGTVDNVAAEIENYFNKEPRILIEEGKNKNIYQLVRYELNKRSKFEILSSREEQVELAKVRERSSQAVYNDELRCKGGVQVSANSLLKISKEQNNLILDLHSAEKGCLMASGAAEMRGNIETAVAEAVENLLKNLLGDVKMPRESQGLEVVVKFTSVPSGATVLSDGKLLCKMTPCSKILTVGPHEISMQMEDNCFDESRKAVTIQRRDDNLVDLNLVEKKYSIKIYAQDEIENDLSADVFVDDIFVGKTPNEFKIPLCSKEIIVKKNGFVPHLQQLFSRGERSKILAVLKRTEAKGNTLDSLSLKTGLMWSNKSVDLMSWNAADLYCQELKENGYSDWRLPDIDELRTLIKNSPKTETGGLCKVSEKNGCLRECFTRKDCAPNCDLKTNQCQAYVDGRYSKKGDVGWFWSSSVEPEVEAIVWRIDFSDAGLSYEEKSENVLSNVRCVRDL
ncbi:DUF1566 domain-containing protein [bacterium]|nr:DUF1566 domain-containing protein [bacterium]MBP5434199.1 DUF1566 domain-containing protein [bacterium]